MTNFIEKVQKITDEYGQLHEEFCDLNNKDGSFDGCDCAMKFLSEEVAKLFTQQLDELKEKIEGVRVESARKTSSKNADEYRAYCTGGEEMQNRILTIINSMK